MTVKEPEYVYYHAGGQRGSRPVLRGAAAKDTFSSIPVVDVSGMFSKHIEDRKKVAAEVGKACREVGFFYAKNHNVPDEVIANTFEAVKNFFAMPNMKEAFSFGDDPHEPEQNAPCKPGPDAPKRANAWPSAYPEFRPAMYDYFTRVKAFSQALMRIFALALDLPEDFFDAAISFPMVGIRALHYPPQEKPNANDIGLGAHTDYDFFTLVQQENVAALQVLNANGIWIDAPPQPRTYVVNVGDFLSRITNNKFKSTVHRVLNKSGEERYSMPFFFSPNREAMLSVVPNCREKGQVYEDINAGDYFMERLKAARWQHPSNNGKPAPVVQDMPTAQAIIA
ncbi:Clavaminate synthase-like protein [Mytilinidion resinicola]|uniref:Clavaminate synthase-like protein n=1 Tax=Mytilinidion resinicola TaxID=574789 RepID=A0A6A6YRI4_9PEZI|nr:Clavaminate synthase-like protein [Mytilinidion resinicola]KAF2811381.1 Clavaminate synthase-like protein [Mytilinidion resinicola]